LAGSVCIRFTLPEIDPGAIENIRKFAGWGNLTVPNPTLKFRAIAADRNSGQIFDRYIPNRGQPNCVHAAMVAVQGECAHPRNC